MILCIGATPATQRVMIFPSLILDGVNRAVQTLDGAAGKSLNVAKVLKALGQKPLAVGFLGGDRGQYLESLLTARGIKHEFLRVPARTRQCITVIDQSRRTQTELVEESAPVDPGEYRALGCIIQKRLPGVRAAIMSGTLTPGGPADFYQRCTRKINSAGALSVIDAQGRPLLEALKARPGLIKPNRNELQASVGRALARERDVLRAMQELFEQGANRVVVTAGKAPSFAFDGKAFWRIRTPTLAVVNPIGSGDAFTAALVWRLLAGDDLGEACRWGAAAGAANALTQLAGELDPKTMRTLYRRTMIESIGARRAP